MLAPTLISICHVGAGGGGGGAVGVDGGGAIVVDGGALKTGTDKGDPEAA